MVASLWAATATPYLVLALVVPVARALGVFGSLPVPAVAALSTLVGPVLVAALPRLAAPLPESLDGWLDAEHRKLAALWAAGGMIALSPSSGWRCSWPTRARSAVPSSLRIRSWSITRA